MPELKPGEVFANYRCIEKLGKGGFGEVYRVKEIGGNQIVSMEFALKLTRDLLPEDATSSDRDKLVQEAHIWQACSQHAHISQLVKAGVENDQFYMVSQYIAGGSLRKKIGLNPGRPQVTQLWAVELVCAVLKAVIHLHTPRNITGYKEARQVLHGDLKPENILMDGDVPKITDFGLSLPYGSSRSLHAPEMGTGCYNAPEVYKTGMTSSNDAWSCAVILYELLAGRLPFWGDNQHQMMYSILNSPLPPLPACVPDALRAIVERALQKEASARYGSVREMLGALDDVRVSLGASMRSQPICLKTGQDCCLLKAVEPLETPVVARKKPPLKTKEESHVLTTPHVANVPKRNSAIIETPLVPKVQSADSAPEETLLPKPEELTPAGRRFVIFLMGSVLFAVIFGFYIVPNRSTPAWVAPFGLAILLIVLLILVSLVVWSVGSRNIKEWLSRREMSIIQELQKRTQDKDTAPPDKR